MINLIPEDIRKNNHYAYRNVQLLRYTIISALTMVAIAVITAISILGMHNTQNNLSREISSQTDQLGQYKPLEDQSKQLSEQLNTINSVQSKKISVSDILPKLAKIMPEGAILKQLNFTTSDIIPTNQNQKTAGSAASSTPKPFVILASVKERSIAAQLLDNIRASDSLFTQADLVDVSQNSTQNIPDEEAPKYPYQVTINAYLKKIDAKPQTTGGSQ